MTRGLRSAGRRGALLIGALVGLMLVAVSAALPDRLSQSVWMVAPLQLVGLGAAALWRGWMAAASAAAVALLGALALASSWSAGLLDLGALMVGCVVLGAIRSSGAHPALSERSLPTTLEHERAVRELMRSMLGLCEPSALASAVAHTLSEQLGCAVAVFARQRRGADALDALAHIGEVTLDEAALRAARTCLETRTPLDRALDGGRWQRCVPLLDDGQLPGVLTFEGADRSRWTHDHLGARLAVVAHALGNILLELERRDRWRRDQAEQMHGTLLSTISHDLRTPLGTILGSAGALLDRQVAINDADRRVLLEGIRDEALRLRQQLENLIEITRVEAGGRPVRSDWQVPSEVIGAALRPLSRVLKGREVRIHCAVELAHFDVLLVQAALLRLVENAALHTPPGAPIDVVVRAGDGAMIVEVSDEGDALDDDELARIFDKFYRGRHSTAPGLGLGLAITRAVVETHGGQLWVRPRADRQGLTFGFSLPQPEGAALAPYLDSGVSETVSDAPPPT